MSIEFTQYLRPNGERKKIFITRPEEIENKAIELEESGLVFEAEVLTTGVVSLTVATIDDEDIDIELASNGPDVPAAVDRMIKRVHSRVMKGRE